MPDWTYGGNPAGSAQLVNWDIRPTETAGIWLVRNAEAKSGASPKLLRLFGLGKKGAHDTVDAYTSLHRLKRHDDLMNPAFWEVAVDRHEKLMASHSTELSAMLHSARTLLIAAPKAELLPELVQQIIHDWFAKPLPGSSAHFVDVSDVLSARYTMVRVLLYDGEPPEPGAGSPVFASSAELLQDLYIGLSSYLEPLFTSLAPYVWGMTASRAGGVIAFLFGEVVDGRRATSADPISLSEPLLSRSSGSLEPPQLEPRHFQAALNWWIGRLDLTFSHITDPTNYEVSGEFDPSLALERMLTFQQVCRGVQSLALSRDDHVRRLLLFNVLDMLPGLSRAFDWKVTTSATRAGKLLERVRAQIPDDVGAVVLPRAVRAVDALVAVQSGFFMRTVVSDEEVRLPDSNGVLVAVPKSTAASLWLRTLRNTQHGFDKPSPRDRALLAAHNGEVPTELADLAWLYLLAILADPSLLRRASRAAREG